jgi:aminomethyltransferase
MINRTPLYASHRECHGNMVDFHGWEMPLHYGSQIEEHQQVRQHAGMFDVSHMTIVDISGTKAKAFLQYLLTNDVDKLQPGKALYTCMCLETGGILDDLIVYDRATNQYRLVLNAATKNKDLAWIHTQAQAFDLELQPREDLSILAVQGPEAIEKTLTVLNTSQKNAIAALPRFGAATVGDWFFARTGYTGEDGLEIMLPNTEVTTLWFDLLHAHIQPCGLAARDTLRLEAGMLLYGQDMDESTTPLESGLGWTIAWEPSTRDFIGKSALSAQKEAGVTQKMVGLILQDKGIMRHNQRVLTKENGEGIITSGGFSPTLKQSIALARIPLTKSDQVMVDIRGRLLPAQIVKPRFV